MKTFTWQHKNININNKHMSNEYFSMKGKGVLYFLSSYSAN